MLDCGANGNYAWVPSFPAMHCHMTRACRHIGNRHKFVLRGFEWAIVQLDLDCLLLVFILVMWWNIQS